MTMQEMIYKRKSCRSFTGVPVAEDLLKTIRAFPMKPLYPDIGVHWDFVPRDQVKCICPWTTPQVITVYSQEKEGYMENIGFLFQQLDLYLQTLGLGVCWLGLGRLNAKASKTVEGMKFVIMLAFGHPKGDALRHDTKEFKRKAAERIADRPDAALEPARLAPSAVNAQPWYFTHQGDTIHAYCAKLGNKLDVGIALAQLYIANEESFRFFREDSAPKVSGYSYIGSVKL